jgi:bacillithiol system protein YtxJ
MDENFVTVAGADELEKLFARSHEEPVLLFKHSLTCPISSAANAQMRKVAGEVSLVVVQKARDVSREVEARTGVRHESPQALVIVDGRAVWTESHWGITAEKVEQALRDARREREVEPGGASA